MVRGRLAVLFTAMLLATATPAPAAEVKAAQPPELTLPVFGGRTLEGRDFSTSSIAGKRLVVFCFNPGLEHAGLFAQALARIAPERQRHNFAIVGVAMGLDPAAAASFVRGFGLDFPILDDADARISSGLRLASPLVLFGADADGRVALTMGSFENEELQPAAQVESRLRRFLRLPESEGPPSGALERGPVAPEFEARPLGEGEPFRLADHRGKPLVIVFFLHTCPHCHTALAFYRDALAEIPEAQRPLLIGISAETSAYSVHAALEDQGVDFFPVFQDRDRSIRDAYGVFAGTPDTVFIAGGGRIVERVQGWNETINGPLVRMTLAKMAGAPVPLLLRADGFSGNEACSVCHEREAQAWSFTAHAAAFATLVPLGRERDRECVGCHVVGFEQPGGWTLADPRPHVENVGCENCHGKGGGHVKAADRITDFPAACLGCHNEKHSVGFDYATFLPKVSHAAILALSDQARAGLVAGRGRPRDLLPSTVAMVGSDACRSCHENEYATWVKSPHGRAVESLRRKGKERDEACLACHVTGFDRPGGFAEGARARDFPDLARVGCESCHGPGAEHVKEGADRRATILGLGDKCDSCVVQQICGACHDEANDPEFRFRIDERIEAQRHGTHP
jgi:peroxiredoxin